MTTGPALPSGMVTFVFTDIEGSTRLLRERREHYDEMLDLHHAALRAAWRAHGGVEVNTEGDAFFVAFTDARAALAAVVDGQRRIAAVQWPEGIRLRVRMGMHTGYARPTATDYRALAVNQTARVVSVAHGGQILLTEDTAARLAAPDGAELVPLGRYRLRDFDEPVALYTVAADGMPTVDTRPLARPADGHNLVPPSTALMGREAEAVALKALVRPGRIVTVAGPGGVGKTRLVTEVGIEVAPQWPDGVWFVDLAPLSAADQIPMAIASAVGVPVDPATDVVDSVLAHLRDRTALLLLDNCEQLLAGVARNVVRLAEAARTTGIVATSRAPLGLRAETVYRLGPLPTSAYADDGVQLFLDRVGSAGVVQDIADVIALCTELDGLPLAIELAAARATAIPPAAILERVRRSRPGLTSQDPGLPERQRSLERTLDWSYELLDPLARTALRRLSVFAGSFDIAGARIACADGDELHSDEVDDQLWTLLDSSLVTIDTADGMRYRLLHTVRAYATARVARDEARDAALRLGRGYLEWIGPMLAIGREWVDRMSAELDNVRQIVGSLARDGRPEAVELAQQLAWSIGCLHNTVDTYRTGVPELTQLAAALRDPTPSRVALLAILADLHFRVNEADEAAPLLAEAEMLASEVGHPPWDDAAVVRGAGELATRRGDQHTAVQLARDALTTSRSPRSRTRLYNLLGIALSDEGDMAGATDAFMREIDAARLAGMATYEVNAHGNLAEVLLRQGDNCGAAAHQLEALEMARAMRQPVQVAFSMVVAARLMAEDKEWADAVRLHSAADALLAQTGIAMYESDLQQSREVYARAREHLGDVAFEVEARAGSAQSADAAADMAAAHLRRVATSERSTA